MGVLAVGSLLTWEVLGFTPHSITLLSDAGLGKSSLVEQQVRVSPGEGTACGTFLGTTPMC